MKTQERFSAAKNGNGRHEVPTTGATSEPPAPVPAAKSGEMSIAVHRAAMAVLERALMEKSGVLYQLHIRGQQNSGKSTLATAIADVVQHGTFTGPSARTDGMYGQSHNVLKGAGTGPTGVSSHDVQKLDLTQIESFTYNGPHNRRICITSFPHDPAGGPDARHTIDLYRRNPQAIWLPVLWGPRLTRAAAQNTYFGLAGELQANSSKTSATRELLRAAFGLAFNPGPDRGMESYGVDGLEEMMADDELDSHRIRVNRRSHLARISFEGLGNKSKKYETILAELAGKVVRSADLDGHFAYRDILHSLPDPLLYVAGWDLVIKADALCRQPNLAQDIFQKMVGTRAMQTNRNLFAYGSIQGRVKVGPQPGKVYVQNTAPEGPAAVLDVVQERVAAHQPQQPNLLASAILAPTTAHYQIRVSARAARLAVAYSVLISLVLLLIALVSRLAGWTHMTHLTLGLGLAVATLAAVAVGAISFAGVRATKSDKQP